MESAFDMRPLLRALARHWRWIITTSVLAAVISGGLAATRPPTYTSTAILVMSSAQSEVSLDPRFTTSQILNVSTLRMTILALARSVELESQLPPEVRARYLRPGDQPGKIVRRIKVQSRGDLLTIRAQAPTADQAHELSSAWGATLARYVNELYRGRNVVAAESQEQLVKTANDRYLAAQDALEAYIGSSPISKLDQRIAAITSVIDSTRESDQARYTRYLQRAQQLEAVLDEARALRGEIAEGGTAPGATALASLLLRARSVSGGELPLDLQVDTAGFDREGQVTIAELDGFIEALQRQIGTNRTVATGLGKALVLEGHAPDSELSTEQRESYFTQLQELSQQREVESGKLATLEAERKVTLEALEVMRRKLQEQQVGSLQPDSQLSSTSSAVSDPVLASRGQAIVLGMLLGGLAGALFGCALALLRPLLVGQATRQTYASET